MSITLERAIASWRTGATLLLLTALAVPSPAAPPDLEGFEKSSEVQRFGPENLWEYINGGAEVFVDLGFEQLEVMDYTGADDLSFTLSVYDMGSALGAFGIFHTEISEKASVLEIGGGATVSPPYQGLMYKDRWYIKIETLEGELTQTSGAAALSTVANALAGADGEPAELSSLPSDEQIPGSRGYTVDSYLGLSELRHCVYASYRDAAAREYQVFRIVPFDDETPETIWKALEARWVRLDQSGQAALARMVPYSGLAGVIRDDEGQLLGVAGCPSKEILQERLRRLVE